MTDTAKTAVLKPTDILQTAYTQHDATKVAISFSGAEDVVLIDMACQVYAEVQVFSLDTGRLHPETYQFIETVREHYGIEIEVLSPDAAAVEQLVKEKGLFSFYEDGHTECCGIRKIEPLRRHLTHLDAWITGQRRDQSPTRAEVPQVQEDQAFSDERRTLMKYNPLAEWTSAEVWQYIREHNVPYNKLHDRGFMSIGCEPCTRPVGPNMHERAGRWWWEEATKRECGLHVINLTDDQ
ncbi:MAG: phosphoadenylyl-sulfate reductase [Pseudomonadales bacterium]